MFIEQLYYYSRLRGERGQICTDYLLQKVTPAKAMDEPRWSVIGKINGKHWSAVITYRADNFRNISVRRSSDEEIELYENI